MTKRPARQPRVEVQSAAGTLPDEWKQIIVRLFPHSNVISVERELGGGFSDCRLFTVRAGGTVEWVVKLGPSALVKEEHDRLKQLANPSWQRIGSIEDKVFLADWGGLKYQLMGGVYQVKSFYNYALESPEDAVVLLQTKLFPVMEQAWSTNDHTSTFRYRASYGPVLPVDLELVPIGPVDYSPPRIVIDAQESGVAPLRPGDVVYLNNFWVEETKHDQDGKRCTLTLSVQKPRGIDAEPARLWRIRLHYWLTGRDGCPLAPGQPLGPTYAVVKETRATLLRRYAQEAIGLGVNLDLPSLSVPGRDAPVPNPLFKVDEALNKPFAATFAVIHGDLNLENILVMINEKDLRLIDFGQTRRDHVLHDFLRLEANIITRILPELLTKENPKQGAATVMRELYEQLDQVWRDQRPRAIKSRAVNDTMKLLTAIREFARGKEKDNWRQRGFLDDRSEYYHGLSLYLLGSLKYKTLKREGRELAYWGAAMALALAAELYEGPPPAPTNRLKQDEKPPIIIRKEACAPIETSLLEEIGQHCVSLLQSNKLRVVELAAGRADGIVYERREPRPLNLTFGDGKTLTIQFEGEQGQVSIPRPATRAKSIHLARRCWYVERYSANVLPWLRELRPGLEPGAGRPVLLVKQVHEFNNNVPLYAVVVA